MGLTITLKAAYFRMTVPPNQYYGYAKFGSYTNDSSEDLLLKSVTLYCGTGKGTFTAVSTVTGDGGAFTLRVYVNGSSSGIYGDARITNVMTPLSGGYPDKADCIGYTFVFNNPVLVKSSQSVDLWWETQDRTDTKCLCFDYNRGSASTGPNNYTVTFDLNGGIRTGGGALVQSVPPGGNATPPTCSRTGYTFSKWDKSYTNIQSNTTITAVWNANTYQVIYDLQGGSNGPSNQIKEYNVPLTLSSITPNKAINIQLNPNQGDVNPTDIALPCAFISWNSKQDGSGTSYLPGSTYTANASINLYAQYEYPKVSDLPNATRSKCRFKGWTTELNNADTLLSANSKLTTNITLYALWDYAVELNANGGSIYIPDYFVGTETVTWIDDEGIEHTEEVEIYGKDFPSYTMYKEHGVPFIIPDYMCSYYDTSDPDGTITKEFKGYSITSDSQSVEFIIGDEITEDAPITLYAIYDALVFTVIFRDGYTDGDSGIIKKYDNVPYGASVDPPPDPVRPGYNFSGWLGSYNNITVNRTIYALWGFVPIWIMSDKGWIGYEPKE